MQCLLVIADLLLTEYKILYKTSKIIISTQNGTFIFYVLELRFTFAIVSLVVSFIAVSAPLSSC